MLKGRARDGRKLTPEEIAEASDGEDETVEDTVQAPLGKTRRLVSIEAVRGQCITLSMVHFVLYWSYSSSDSKDVDLYVVMDFVDEFMGVLLAFVMGMNLYFWIRSRRMRTGLSQTELAWAALRRALFFVVVALAHNANLHGLTLHGVLQMDVLLYYAVLSAIAPLLWDAGAKRLCIAAAVVMALWHALRISSPPFLAPFEGSALGGFLADDAKRLGALCRDEMVSCRADAVCAAALRCAASACEAPGAPLGCASACVVPDPDAPNGSFEWLHRAVVETGRDAAEQFEFELHRGIAARTSDADGVSGGAGIVSFLGDGLVVRWALAALGAGARSLGLPVAAGIRDGTVTGPRRAVDPAARSIDGVPVFDLRMFDPGRALPSGASAFDRLLYCGVGSRSVSVYRFHRGPSTLEKTVRNWLHQGHFSPIPIILFSFVGYAVSASWFKGGVTTFEDSRRRQASFGYLAIALLSSAAVYLAAVCRSCTAYAPLTWVQCFDSLLTPTFEASPGSRAVYFEQAPNPSIAFFAWMLGWIFFALWINEPLNRASLASSSSVGARIIAAWALLSRYILTIYVFQHVVLVHICYAYGRWYGPVGDPGFFWREGFVDPWPAFLMGILFNCVMAAFLRHSEKYWSSAFTIERALRTWVAI